jgi:hypothetical protein
MIRSLPLQLVLIACVFAISRGWPLSIAEPWSYWEVFEAKKLNYYGWIERRGALLDVHFLAGVVPQPDLHNYPNHPAPIHWANMLVHRALGDWGVIALGTLLGFAACVAALFALRQFYSSGVALIGALVFTIAPTTIIYDVDPNQGALGAVFWPFAALALGTSLPIRGRAWLLGVACLLSGQASWMVWIIFGALVVGVAGVGFEGRFRAAPQRQLIVALLAGGGLTVLLFALQVVLYTSDWQDLKRYLSKQSVEQVGFLTWLIRATTRSAMSLGPALALGALAGILAIFLKKKARPIECVALVFLPLFGFASFVLRGFFQTENWPYEYLVFPASILSCAFLAAVPAGARWRASVAALLVLGVAGLPYVFLRFSNPSLSAETRFVADLIAGETRPHEVVVTNLIDQAPPLQPWNVAGLYIAMHKADRLLRSNIFSVQQLETLLDQFHVDALDVVYIQTRQQPVAPDLGGILDRMPSRHFALPTHAGSLPFSLQLRNYYWKLARRHQAPAQQAMATTDNTIELSRLRISRSHDGDVLIQARSFDDDLPASIKPATQ